MNRRLIRIPKNRRPSYPGELLQNVFMEPMGLSINIISDIINLNDNIILKILNNEIKIDDEIANKLGKLFETTSQFWKNAQISCDLYDKGYRGIINLDKIENMA